MKALRNPKFARRNTPNKIHCKVQIKYKAHKSEGADKTAQRKPRVCEARHMRLSKRGEAKHTNITNKRVQNTRKGAEGKSTTQTRSLQGKAHQHNKQTNVCKRRGEPRGKALHKPDVCEAKHTNITNKRVQTGEGSRREKHYTNPLFARRSTPI